MIGDEPETIAHAPANRIAALLHSIGNLTDACDAFEFRFFP